MFTRFVLATTAALGLAGCSIGEVGEVKLAVDVAPITVSTGSTETTGADGALNLSRVRVLVAHAKIGYTHERSMGASAEAGPYVVELTADEITKGAHREFSLGSLPTGIYGGAEIEIEPLDNEDDQSDPAVADFVAGNASVLVEGTYNGSAFAFAGHFLAEQGTDGDVQVDVVTPVSLAMTVDASSWFESGDPTAAAQHDALAVAICKTLDTQPQTSDAQGGDAHGHGGKGGGDAHCVEATQ